MGIWDNSILDILEMNKQLIDSMRKLIESRGNVEWVSITEQNENGKYETLCVVDEDTGVNYIVVSGEMYSKSVGIAITPRLNADGSLYTSK